LENNLSILLSSELTSDTPKDKQTGSVYNKSASSSQKFCSELQSNITANTQKPQSHMDYDPSMIGH